MASEANAPVVVAPLTCSDGEQNESETDVDCGGPDCDPCDDDASCVEPTDCASGICTEGVCIAPECGDGIVNGDEECDPGRETKDCDADCTFPKCGDGYVNERAEECEPDPDLGPWQRCGSTCIHGVNLDGTWRDVDLPGTDSPWELLQIGSGLYGYYVGMQSFHYAGMKYLFDLTGNQRYDIKNDIWSPLPNELPYAIMFWENAAVDGRGLWVPRASAMHRLDLETLEWTTPTVDLPDGSATVNGSGAVYDSDGFIWYVGASEAALFLVKYAPTDGSFDVFSYADDFPGFEIGEARLAYDPLSNKILAAGRLSTRFLIFDLDSEEFTQSSPSPYGWIRNNACQDRAGGVYVGSTGLEYMYRYDIAGDDFTELPVLPAVHDDVSACVVSELGYLYYGTSTGPTFARLRLNQR